MTFTQLSKKQKEVFKWCHRKNNIYDNIICDGAVRSGKTICMVTSFVLWAMKNFNNAIFGICGKTVQSAERNIILPLQSIIDITAYFKVTYTRSSKLLIVEGNGHKNSFFVFGGRDESSYTLIQGITLSGVFFDEVALMPQSFVEQAIARTLSVINAKLWFNCNPDRPTHWFYQEWIKKADERNTLHLHFLMSDNPTLSDEQLKKASEKFTGVFHDRYIKGLWVNAEGIIYKQFAENEQSYYISRSKLPMLREINIGVDFGGNKSQHAFVATGFSADYKKIYVLKSKCIEATGTSVEDIVNGFRKFADEIKKTYGKVDYVYADCNEQAIINEMRNKTEYDVYDSIKNEIIDRIRCTDVLLTSHRLLLVEGENETLADGLRNALWDSKKLDDVRLDDGTTNIDILDAFEYSFEANLSDLLEG